MAAVVDTNTLANLVQPSKLAEQNFSPLPLRVSVIFGVDHTGEEAYHVYLVFPDKTLDSELAWSKVSPMVRWVRNQIWEHDGERHWPYVRVKRETELPSGKS